MYCLKHQSLVKNFCYFPFLCHLVLDFVLQSFPEVPSIGRLRNVREDGVLLEAGHRIRIRLIVGARGHSKESILWIDSPQFPFLIELHPSNVITCQSNRCHQLSVKQMSSPINQADVITCQSSRCHHLSIKQISSEFTVATGGL